MNTRAKGDAFERKAFELIEKAVIDGLLGVLPRSATVYRRKGYYSHDRKSAIEFDIAIEVTLPGASTYSVLWLWECKDYGHAIPVDDVEEFYSKVQQVGGVNVKAGIITSGSLQRGALEFARSKGMSVVRIFFQVDVEWLLYRKELAGETREELTDAIDEVLTNPHCNSATRDLLGLSGHKSYDSMRELLSDGLSI